MGQRPFIVAKIERAGALAHLDGILRAADGIMVARGDLGVEVPIEEIAITQKKMIARANLAGKPVIVATQMLESMTSSRLPTRAEATDVANAIIDGTDAVMLSAESAMGLFPEEAVRMLARIAAFTEANRPRVTLKAIHELCEQDVIDSPGEAESLVVEHALQTISVKAVFVPFRSGATVRMISRFKPPAWIVAAGSGGAVGSGLLFSYGVYPVEIPEEPESWASCATAWLKKEIPDGGNAILVAGPSAREPQANYRMEFLKF
jgi:pyruvate kinase